MAIFSCLNIQVDRSSEAAKHLKGREKWQGTRERERGWRGRKTDDSVTGVVELTLSLSLRAPITTHLWLTLNRLPIGMWAAPLPGQSWQRVVISHVELSSFMPFWRAAPRWPGVRLCSTVWVPVIIWEPGREDHYVRFTWFSVLYTLSSIESRCPFKQAAIRGLLGYY